MKGPCDHPKTSPEGCNGKCKPQPSTHPSSKALNVQNPQRKKTINARLNSKSQTSDEKGMPAFCCVLALVPEVEWGDPESPSTISPKL